MTDHQAGVLVRDLLHDLAQEVDPETADLDAPPDEELDLDSIAFLALVERLEGRAGVRVPERDSRRLWSVHDLIGHLASRSS
jgi:acyl carrier protein